MEETSMKSLILCTLLILSQSSAFISNQQPQPQRHLQRITKIPFIRTPLRASKSEEEIIDQTALGQWSDADVQCMTKFEWEEGEDKNALDPSLEFVADIPVDEEGVELGWDPIFGPSNPIDQRTVITPVESYMMDEQTRDENIVDILPFPVKEDPENALNEEVSQIRKDMKIIDTYYDPYLQMEVPRNQAEWFGHLEEESFPKKDFYNNRFTKDEDRTDFEKLSPYRARKKAVEMARSWNNEWLPEGKADELKRKETDVFRKKGVLAGSMQKGDIDEELVEQIRPALDILGNIVELLSTHEGTVYRFKYHGPLKHKRGMAAYAETLIRDCDMVCTGVVFETAGRVREHWNDS